MTDEYSATQGETAGTAIDTTVPHSARIWNYWLGGKDNYEVDRRPAISSARSTRGYVDMARADRAFLGRVIRYVAGEAGVRQFLDVGTGLPTAANTHQVAQESLRSPDRLRRQRSAGPGARPGAADQQPEGAVEYLDADIRNPDTILDTAAGLLDFKQPIALMLMGIIGHFTDDEAYPIVARLLAGLPSGSYFALYDGADTNEAFKAAQQGYNDSGAVPYYLRSPAQFTPFFDGLELVEPGLVPVPHWRPDPGAEPVEIYSYCGVARKP